VSGSGPSSDVVPEILDRLVIVARRRHVDAALQDSSG
jgi:hypothetical protein